MKAPRCKLVGSYRCSRDLASQRHVMWAPNVVPVLLSEQRESKNQVTGVKEISTGVEESCL